MARWDSNHGCCAQLRREACRRRKNAGEYLVGTYAKASDAFARTLQRKVTEVVTCNIGTAGFEPATPRTPYRKGGWAITTRCRVS